MATSTRKRHIFMSTYKLYFSIVKRLLYVNYYIEYALVGVYLFNELLRCLFHHQHN